MQKISTAHFSVCLIATIVFFSAGFTSIAAEHGKNQNSQPVPVRVTRVEIKMVSDQISLVGTAEAIAKSTHQNQADLHEQYNYSLCHASSGSVTWRRF
ncbi:MAG TPA: hypothetical protein VMW95_06860 [Desulfobacterales bacterium]|nr:hypothetical protein [Desulfobacterales bacterium]